MTRAPEATSTSPEGADLVAALGEAVPGIQRSTSPVDRVTYARDLWPRHHIAVRDGRIAEHRPAGIVWPASAEEARQVVAFCAREGVPLVPFGAGSGVCGGVLPDPRAVILDLKRMRRWRTLDRVAGSLEVEAGAMGITLEEDLNREGFTLGHFPSSILCSTVGGWVAARSAGQCSGLYGKIEDMTAALECVVGRGELVRFERRTHGPDLTPLLIGSEGVLGVVTAARLRLHPLPAARAFGGFSFPTIEAGITALRELFQAGLRPAVSRLYDAFDSMMARRGAVRRARKAAHGEPAGGPRGGLAAALAQRAPGAGAAALRTVLRAPSVLNRLIDAVGDRVLGGATLVLIFEGESAAATADLARAAAIASRHGARALGEEPARHWLAHRYSVSYRQAPVFMAGAFADTMEVAAPWSRLLGLYESVRSALGRHVFVMAHLSHAYPDGCSIYFTFAGSAPTAAEAEAIYDAAWRSALDAAIAAGGTLSHHHGVGRSKAPRLGSELGLGVEVVHALRGLLDPAGVMNPGNLLPASSAGATGLPRPPMSRPPASPALDRLSLTLHVSGSTTLAEVERAAAAEGLSFALGDDAPPRETTIDGWIADGAHGAPDPWSDPVDHLVAGFTARLASGAELEVRPAPRRAVGPDLFALFLGMGGRVGVITAAHLRVQSAAPRPMPCALVRDPPIEPAEQRWIDGVVSAVGGVSQ